MQRINSITNSAEVMNLLSIRTMPDSRQDNSYGDRSERKCQNRVISPEEDSNSYTCPTSSAVSPL